MIGRDERAGLAPCLFLPQSVQVTSTGMRRGALKLYIPPLWPNLVERRRLTERLEEGR